MGNLQNQIKSYKLTNMATSPSNHIRYVNTEMLLQYHHYINDAIEEILNLLSLTALQSIEKKINYVWGEYSTLLLELLQGSPIGNSNSFQLPNNSQNRRRGQMFMNSNMFNDIQKMNTNNDIVDEEKLQSMLAQTNFSDVIDEDEKARQKNKKG